MKIRQYQELCKVCNQILINNMSTPQIVANSYLDIIRLHPEVIKKRNLPRFANIYLPIRFRLIAVLRLLQSIFVKKHKFQQCSELEVLFVSHLTNSQQLSKDSDVYFGGLPNQLSEKGFKSGIVLLNPTGVTNEKISNSWKRSKVARFVLNSSLCFLSEVRLYVDQIRSKKLLNYIIRDLQINSPLAKATLLHHFSSGTFITLRVAIQIENIIKKTNAKYIITTYEGHAWERLVYYYARRANPNIKCFGYQHSAVFEHQNSIRRPLNSDYNPDVVLTSGTIAENIFKQSQLKIGKVVCLGSSKHSPPSLSPCESKCCLVIPEGFISESLILFKLSLNYAIQYQDQKFIWRLHPSLSFDKLKKHSPIFKKIPNNIYLSESNLDNDIKKCNSVLYRGSTAVVDAINAGLKPIYYQLPVNELNIDPIYQCHKGKFVVNNQNDLRIAFCKDINEVSRQSLQDFAQDFYTPINIDVLLKEINI